MTINRRDFFVRSAGAIAAGKLSGNQLHAAGQTPVAEMLYVNAKGPVSKYNLANSLFAGNQHLYGSGFGPPVNFKPLESSVLALPPSSKVADKPVQMEMDQTKRNYLHVVEGTLGSDLGAGLLTKKA